MNSLVVSSDISPIPVNGKIRTDKNITMFCIACIIVVLVSLVLIITFTIINKKNNKKIKKQEKRKEDDDEQHEEQVENRDEIYEKIKEELKGLPESEEIENFASY